MKAVRFHAARDVRIENVEQPADPGPMQVLVRNRICGICGTDLHEYAAGPLVIPQLPHPYTGSFGTQILGHEYGGEVVAVGERITHVKPGDRVSIQPLISPRDDYFGKLGLHHLSDQLGCVGLSWPWGGMAEYSIVNDYNVMPVSDDVSDDECALFEPAAVAVHAIDRSGIGLGSSVLVVGAGPIGALSVLAARAAGASRIFISDVNEKRLALMKQILPECITINPPRDNVSEIVLDLTAGNAGVDAAIECVGNGQALNDCIKAVRRQGVVVQVGLHKKPTTFDALTLVGKEMELRGSLAYPMQVWPRIASLVGSGVLPVHKIVTRRIGMTEVIEQGFEALLDPAGGDVKILMDTAA